MPAIIWSSFAGLAIGTVLGGLRFIIAQTFGKL